MNKNSLAIGAVMIAAIFLIIITAQNVDTRKEVADFNPATTYSYPITQKNIDEAEQYSALTNNGNALTCPNPLLSTTTQGVFSLRGQGSSYTHTNFFLPVSALFEGQSDNVTTATTDWDSLVKDTVLEDVDLSGSGFNYLDFAIPNYAGYFEIIAPFNFTFANINTSDDYSIVIYNVGQTVKFTFQDCANWFCAGNSFVDDWAEHGVSDSNPHYSIIGNSNNSKVKSGNAGDVIGYGDAATSLSIEVLVDGDWEEISIQDWIMN